MRLRTLELACLLILTGCQSRTTDAPATTAQLERLWSIADSNDSLPLFGTLEPFQVASNGRDRIYALSRASFRVLVFDSAGHLVDSVGRKGKGPGELADPWAISVDRSGTLNVSDLGKHRLVRWSGDRGLLPEVPITDALDHPRVDLNGDTLLLLTRGVTPSGDKEFELIQRIGPDRRTLAVLPREIRLADFPSCQAFRITTAPLFAPMLLWSAVGDRIAISSGNGYSVAVFDHGLALGAVTRPIAPIRATPELARAEAANWMINDCTVPPDEVVRSIGYQPEVQLLRSVVLSPAGALWVERRNPEGSGDLIDHFTPELTFVGTLPAGSPMPAAFLGEDRFVVLEHDSLDLPTLTLFRLH